MPLCAGDLTPVRARRRISGREFFCVTHMTYFVALPFVAADDGVAPGEAVECLNSATVIARAEALSRKAGNVGTIASAEPAIPRSRDR